MQFFHSGNNNDNGLGADTMTSGTSDIWNMKVWKEAYPSDLRSASESDESWFFDVLLPIDNASDRCSDAFRGPTCGECPPTATIASVLWQGGRWMKMAFTRLVRLVWRSLVFSAHNNNSATPREYILHLLLVGFFVGLVVGILLTTTAVLVWNRSRDVRSASSSTPNSSTTTTATSRWWLTLQAKIAAWIATAQLAWGQRRWKKENQFVGDEILEKNSSRLSTQSAPRTALSTDKDAVDTTVARQDLAGPRDTTRDLAGVVDEGQLPQHIAMIMDGNRRYGRAQYGQATAGHWEGSRKVLEVAKWCLAEGVPILSLYCLSTENWKRSPAEIEALLQIILQYCDELLPEAQKRGIRIRTITTDPEFIPPHVQSALDKLVEGTRNGRAKLQLNLCLSYGSQSEIVRACRHLAQECVDNQRKVHDISADALQRHLLLSHPPDILLRTSGEFRISNFLLWQLAYTELFFVDKLWPQLTKRDFLQVIIEFASQRKRRFGN